MKKMVFFISMFLPIIGSEGVGDHKRKLDDMDGDILELFYGNYVAGPADDLTDSLADNIHDLNAEFIDVNAEFASVNTQPLDLRPVIRTKHGIFKCFVENCDREFLYKTSFDSHLENDHHIEANYCIARGNNLQRIKKIYSCTFCEYSTSHKHHFIDHTEIHIQTYKCESCDYEASRREDLKTHSKIHAKKRLKLYKCAICDFTFIHKWRLLRHLRSKAHIKKAAEDLTIITKQQDEG